MAAAASGGKPAYYHFVISAHGTEIITDPRRPFPIPINTVVHTVPRGYTLSCSPKLQTDVCLSEAGKFPELPYHYLGPRSETARESPKNYLSFDVELTKDDDKHFRSGLVLCPSKINPSNQVIHDIDQKGPTTLRAMITTAHNFVKTIHPSDDNYDLQISLLACIEGVKGATGNVAFHGVKKVSTKYGGGGSSGASAAASSAPTGGWGISGKYRRQTKKHRKMRRQTRRRR